MASVTSAAGMALSVQDYVRYPNPTAGQSPPNLVAVITSLNSGANTFNATFLKPDGTTGTSSNVQASTAHQLVQASGPGNAETVAFT